MSGDEDKVEAQINKDKIKTSQECSSCLSLYIYNISDNTKYFALPALTQQHI